MNSKTHELIVDHTGQYQPKFNKHKSNEPYLIKNYSANWIAQKEWSFDFLKNLDPNSTINAVVGNAASGKKSIVPMSLENYINSIKEDNFDKYLTTFHLFKKYPFLKKDIIIDEIKKISLFQHLLAWIAPKGAITGFHQDWSENINVQIRGSKVFYLVSPENDKNMYISDKFERISKTSLIDLTNVDYDKFPLFSKVKIYKFILKPSDAIFIPHGWWHYVESLEPSINISIHYWTLKDLFGKLPVELTKVFLHDIGLYKNNNCACHQLENNRLIKRG